MSGNGTSGFLPCFHLHKDDEYPVHEFYGDHVFVDKVATFLSAIVRSSNLHELSQKISMRGTIQHIDPKGNRDDRLLCQELGWQSSKVYRIDYGDTAYRLLFGLDTPTRRCYILALDTLHRTRSKKKNGR